MTKRGRLLNGIVSNTQAAPLLLIHDATLKSRGLKTSLPGVRYNSVDKRQKEFENEASAEISGLVHRPTIFEVNQEGTIAEKAKRTPRT